MGKITIRFLRKKDEDSYLFMITLVRAEHSSFFLWKDPLKISHVTVVKCLLTFGLFPLCYVFLALSILSAICNIKHSIYKGIS